jgi:hypothetical protein
MSIIGDPVRDCLLLFFRNTLVRVGNTLEDVVDVLGNTEYARLRLRYCINFEYLVLNRNIWSRVFVTYHTM